MNDYTGFFRPTSMLNNSGPLMATLDREGYALHIVRQWDELGPVGFAYDWYLSHGGVTVSDGFERTHQRCIKAAYRFVHPRKA